MSIGYIGLNNPMHENEFIRDKEIAQLINGLITDEAVAGAILNRELFKSVSR